MSAELSIIDEMLGQDRVNLDQVTTQIAQIKNNLEILQGQLDNLESQRSAFVGAITRGEAIIEEVKKAEALAAQVEATDAEPDDKVVELKPAEEETVETEKGE